LISTHFENEKIIIPHAQMRDGPLSLLTSGDYSLNRVLAKKSFSEQIHPPP
jgi:hypothetical protein